MKTLKGWITTTCLMIAIASLHGNVAASVIIGGRSLNDQCQETKVDAKLDLGSVIIGGLTSIIIGGRTSIIIGGIAIDDSSVNCSVIIGG